jgi:hypothetical protein
MAPAFALDAGLPIAPPRRGKLIHHAAGAPPTAPERNTEANHFGVHGLIGAFFEDALRANIVGEAPRPKVVIGKGTVPDLELVGHETFVEVKSGTNSDPMRFSVDQLEDYLGHWQEGGHDALYCFVWYRGKNSDGQRTTLASLDGERGKRAIARLHGHLVRETQRALILDARLVGGIVNRLRDELAPRYPGKPGQPIEKVGRVLHTVVDSAFNGDARGRAILKDFAPELRNWRRVTGELPLGSYGEMFAAGNAIRSVPVTAVMRADHADRLIRDGGPLSRILPERQLPKTRYRARRPRRGDDPF